ncbi:MAG: tetratricopeptide repeat protein [Alphaproteobacteria bacterium]
MVLHRKFIGTITKVSIAAILLSACTTGEGVQTSNDADPLRFVQVFNTEIRRADQDYEVFGPYLSARHAAVERDYAKAADLYQTVLDRHPTSTTILSRAFMNALQAGDRKDALQLAAALIESSQSAGISRFVVANDGLSRAAFDDVLAMTADTDESHGMLLEPFVAAWAHVGKGDSETAVATLASMADDPQGDFFSGLALYQQALILSYADAPGATEKFAAAIDLFGGSFRMTRALARHLAVRATLEEALDVLDGFAERFGAENLVTEEKLYLQQNAETVTLLASTPVEGLTEALYLSAASLLAERNYGPASLYLKLVLFGRPNHDLALLMLGNLENLAKDYTAAHLAFAAVPETSPAYLEGQIKAAYALSDMKQVAQAIALLDKSLASAKGRPDEDAFQTEILLAKAGLLRGEEDFTAAQTLYTQLIAAAEASNADPRSYWSLYYMRGMCLERLGRWPEAEVDLLQALKLNPRNPMVMNYLGYSWVDKGERLEEGRKMIEQAAKKRPQDGYIIDSLGWVHYKLGNFEQATEYLQRAVKLEPGDPVVADHYGDALWRADRKIEARFQWRHALKLDPTDELRAQLMLKLSLGLDHADRVEQSMGYDS